MLFIMAMFKIKAMIIYSISPSYTLGDLRSSIDPNWLALHDYIHGMQLAAIHARDLRKGQCCVVQGAETSYETCSSAITSLDYVLNPLLCVCICVCVCACWWGSCFVVKIVTTSRDSRTAKKTHFQHWLKAKLTQVLFYTPCKLTLCGWKTYPAPCLKTLDA